MHGRHDGAEQGGRLRGEARFSSRFVGLPALAPSVVEPYLVYRRYGGTGKDYHEVEDIPYYDYLLSQSSALYLFLKDAITRRRSPDVP